MKLWRPLQLRKGASAHTARRLVPQFENLGLHVSDHLHAMRTRLFRRNYPHADTRLRTRQTLWKR